MAQISQGDKTSPLVSIPDTRMNEEFIRNRVNVLLPDGNFYFYQISDEQEQQAIEEEEIERYIYDNIYSPQLYIKTGCLEPVHLQEQERKVLVEGMIDSLNRCSLEIHKSQKQFSEKTGRACKPLHERRKHIKNITKKFNALTE